MPSLTVDDKGVEFFYVDSGRPNSKVYTTVVVLHGHTFHSGIFKRMLPIASSRDLRLICLNRRDYPGSTPYTSSELKQLSEGDSVALAAFLRARGIEIALFLYHIILSLSLPAPTTDGTEGGLALLGWSLGNVELIAAAANVSSLPEVVKTLLQSYLTNFIMHDPPALALGIEDPPKGYLPLRDDSIAPESRGLAFAHWVSSYFAHRDLHARNLDDLAYKDPDPHRTSTASRMSSQELASVLDLGAGSRAAPMLEPKFAPFLFQQMRSAFFDPELSRWPSARIWMIYCDSSSWQIIYAVWEIEKMVKASIAAEDNVPPVLIHMIKEAHHFAIWDEPEKALDAFANCLRQGA